MLVSWRKVDYYGCMANICLVEDNESIREAVKSFLQLADHQVSDFGTLLEARAALDAHLPDLILMDVMLPDGNGFFFAREFLAEHPVPLIFMSGRESESDRITGFEIGADDYIVKPFSPKELVLRIAAILKRTSETKPDASLPDTVWNLNGQVLHTDENAHRATLDDELLKLTAAEWKILIYFTRNGGTVVSRKQVLDHCLSYSFDGYDRIVDTHVKNLRAKLGNPGWIETVRGYGYRFAGKGGL